MKKKSTNFFILIIFYSSIISLIGREIYMGMHRGPMPIIEEKKEFSQSQSYNDLIKKHSRRYGLDWRFVSSMIDAESSFNPKAVSSAGAVGLMQILPQVALAEGIDNFQEPDQNIRIGLKHFKRYFNTLKGETLDDTLKINLAAYNAGIAHVKDAQKLARLLDLNPNQWSSIEKTLPLLEDEAFLPFVNYGYCQGNSIVSYVQKIFRKYQHNQVLYPNSHIETKTL